MSYTLVRAGNPRNPVVVDGSQDPWILLDGRLGAPSGTPQFPTLLSGYPTASPPNARVRWPVLTGTQPGWEVAGVDYAVGIPSGTVLKDPFQGLSPSTGNLDPALTAFGSVTYSSGGFFIQFSGSSAVTLDGWDFSLNNCQGIVISVSGVPFTIKNCNFKVGSNLRNPIITNASTVTDLTITNNVIDGGKAATAPAGGLINVVASGTISIEYNYVLDSYYQFNEIGPDPSNTLTLLRLKYNVWHNDGFGSPFGAHGDMFHIISSNAGSPTFDNVDIGFNTFVQDDSNVTDGLAARGISLSTGGNTATYLAENVYNNTFVLPVPASTPINISNCFIIDASLLNGTSQITQNFIDPSGLFSFAGDATTWLIVNRVSNGGGSGPYNGTVIRTGNINMLDGSTLTNTQ